MKQSNEHTPYRRRPFASGRLLVTSWQNLNVVTRRLGTMGVTLLVLFASLTLPLPASIVLNNGFEGGTSDWSSTGAWSPTPSHANVSISSTSREGSNAVKFLPVQNENNTIRSEFTVRNELGWFDWGTEYWQGFSMRVIEPTDGYSIVFQHHSVPQSWDSGYAAGPNSFTIRTIDGNLDFRTSTIDSNVNVTPDQNSATWGTESYSMPLTLNTWYDIVLNFRYAPDSTGFIKVWVNGTKVIDITGPTVYNKDRSGAQRQDYQYQKIGLYYGPENWTVGGEIIYDAFRIWEGSGGSYESVAPAGGTLAPAAPSSLTATAASSSQINLSWTDNASNETGFEVDRALNSGFSSGLVTNAYTTGANPGMPVAAGSLSENTTYYFRVRATNASGDSANSNTANATTLASLVLEAEDLTVASNSDSLQVVTDSGASAGEFHLMNANGVGDQITYTVNVPTAGTYQVVTRPAMQSNRGIFQLKINGTNQGSAQDYYVAGSTPQFEERNLGTVTLSAGNHSFRFECTGRHANPQAGNFKHALDYIKLTPQ